MFTLVVMAAGLGSRFGGTKQLAQVGPNGETFLDFAIADAHAAGADKIVLIVRSDIKTDVQAHLRNCLKVPSNLAVTFVCQDQHGPARSKPWGTAHAVLSAQHEITGPFVVCNADDYYGPSAYVDLTRDITNMADNEARLCGYRLEHTLPPQGSVTRGICHTENTRLIDITEQEGLSQAETIYPSDTLVSMNLWAFPEAFFDSLQKSFEQFLSQFRNSSDAEYLLPHAVTQAMRSNLLNVQVVPTAERWIGVTNPDDLQTARANLAHKQ